MTITDKQTTNKVDIFEMLKQIDSGNLNYYDDLTTEQQKSVSMFMASRWMSCTKNSKQIAGINAFVNPVVFKFATKHKSLLYKLMLIASSGTEKHYNWVSKKKTSNKPYTCDIISRYYNISSKDCHTYTRLLTLADVLDCAYALGEDDTTIKKIKNEYK